MTDHYQLVAGHLALDFANTLDNRYGPARRVELLPTYDRFVAFAKQSGILTSHAARRLVAATSPREARQAHGCIIELREALYALFRSVARRETPAASCLATVNRLLIDARVPHHIRWRAPDFISPPPDLTASPMAPLSPILDAAIELLTSPDRRHVRECSAQDCRWLFLDRSKNHSRRWCDMALCGNRAKSRRFQARSRQHPRGD